MINIASFFAPRFDAVKKIPIHASKFSRDLAKTIEGAVFSILSAITLGKHKAFNTKSEKSLRTALLLPRIYRASISIINPKAKYNHLEKEKPTALLASYVVAPIFKYAFEVSQDSESFFKRHIVSRGSYALGAFLSFYIKKIDLWTAIPAVIISTITAGKFSEINTLAIKQLSALSYLDDLCKGLRGFVNPHQFDKKSMMKNLNEAKVFEYK